MKEPIFRAIILFRLCDGENSRRRVTWKRAMAGLMLARGRFHRGAGVGAVAPRGRRGAALHSRRRRLPVTPTAKVTDSLFGLLIRARIESRFQGKAAVRDPLGGRGTW